MGQYRRQQSVSLSTTEAEYIVASKAAKETVWLTRLYKEIISLVSVPVVFMNNASAIKLSRNPQLHRRSKHRCAL